MAPSGAGKVALLRVDPAARDHQTRRLEALRRTRDSARVSDALQRLQQCAGGKENVMPLLVECARARATLGEMAGALRSVFGEYQP